MDLYHLDVLGHHTRQVEIEISEKLHACRLNL